MNHENSFCVRLRLLCFLIILYAFSFILMVYHNLMVKQNSLLNTFVVVKYKLQHKNNISFVFMPSRHGIVKVDLKDVCLLAILWLKTAHPAQFLLVNVSLLPCKPCSVNKGILNFTM